MSNENKAQENAEQKAAKKPAKEKAPKQEKPARPVAPKQHGIAKPAEGTVCAKVWSLADEAAKKAGSVAEASRKEVIAACEELKINRATATTQYGRWRQFHGLCQPRAAAASAAASEAAPASA